VSLVPQGRAIALPGKIVDGGRRHVMAISTKARLTADSSISAYLAMKKKYAVAWEGSVMNSLASFLFAAF
jgi:hypothetical protein